MFARLYSSRCENSGEQDEVPALTELYWRGMQAVEKLRSNVNDINASGDQSFEGKRRQWGNEGLEDCRWRL